jgi:tetratricopeptide (TPR) repeat protein
MKVLLELLGDVRQLLTAIDSMDDVRPQSREKLKVLLEALTVESVRLLEDDHTGDDRREVMFQRALEAISKQRLDEAARILGAAVEKYPNDTELHNHLGLVAWEKGDLESAIEHYDTAIAAGFPGEGQVDWYHERHRPFLRAMEGKALCLYRLERLEKALPVFEALADMNSVEYGGCRYLAGEIRHTLGDVEAAIDDYERVPPEPAVLYNLALGYFEQGRLEDAATTLIKAFVGNANIAELVMGRPLSRLIEVPGYLASEAYAREFYEACDHLWQDDDCLRFVERCFDHPLVHVHVRRCAEKLTENVMNSGPAALREHNWYGELGEDGTLGSIARRILADS